jgi:hypothetical protein
MRNKKRKGGKRKTGQAAIESPTSNLHDNILRQFSHRDNHPAIVRRLPDCYPTVLNHITRLYMPSILIFIIRSPFTQRHSSNHTLGPTLTLAVTVPGNWKTKTMKQARRRSNLGHRSSPTTYCVNFHIVTVNRRLLHGYPKVLNHITQPDIPSILIFIIRSPFTQMHSSNHTFGPTLTLAVPVPGKWDKTKTKEKNKTGEAAIEPRTSNLPHNTLRQFWDRDSHLTVARWLLDCYPMVVNHITRPHISIIIISRSLRSFHQTITLTQL